MKRLILIAIVACSFCALDAPKAEARPHLARKAVKALALPFRAMKKVVGKVRGGCEGGRSGGGCSNGSCG
jgi:hypothetical protein